MTETETKNGTRVVILQDMKNQLALGLKTETGAYEKSLDFKRWNLARNKVLRNKRQLAGDNVTMFSYTSTVLSEMCEKFGPYLFSEMKEMERTIALHQFTMGDILTAYAALRCEAMGPDLSINLQCPDCKKKFKFVADLNTLPIRVADSIEDTYLEWELIEPIEIRQKTVHIIQFEPIKWASIEKLNPRNLGDMEERVLVGSVRALDGVETRLAPGELDEIGKRDLEEMTELINVNALGPDMVVDAVCNDQYCATEWPIQLDWNYDSFFAVTSR